MSRFLLHLLIYLWTLFYFGIKSYKIEQTFKTHDYQSQPYKIVYKPNPSQE